MDIKKRFQEMVARAAYGGRVQFSRFLDPAEQQLASLIARETQVTTTFFGGWPEAERRICAFSPEPWEGGFPLAALELSWNVRFGDLTHRDLLGAAMSLGVERDTLGDIALGTIRGTAYLFCTEDVSAFIIGSMESAGHCALKIQETNDVSIAPPMGSLERATVAQLRLDAIIAAGWHLSRSQAQKPIAQGIVKLNHIPVMQADKMLEAGDLISVRGLGRLKLTEIEGETRKGRIGIRFFLYGKS